MSNRYEAKALYDKMIHDVTTFPNKWQNLVLRGKTEYKAELSISTVGNMVKLKNLFAGIHENEEFLLKKIDQYQNDLYASKLEYKKSFAYETELKEKLAH